MSTNKDQYTAEAGVQIPVAQKLADLDTFMKKHRMVMLTTRSPSGEMHSRCMAPADITKDWKIRFIYDRDSYKDKEVENE